MPLFRKLGNLWFFVVVCVTVTFSVSVLFNKRNQHLNDVFYLKTTTTEESFSSVPVRHVTKSLRELGKMDEINKHVLFFNRIPYCGAEILIFLLQKMQGFNNYKHVRLEGGFYNRLTKIQQEEFVYNLYDVMRREAVPLSFDRQIFFVNFTDFDKQSPTFINMIREPADKLLSRSRNSNRNYKKCLTTQTSCDKVNLRHDELSVSYFCGHNPQCGNDPQWALQIAKNNVEKYYPVVGVLEELNATLEILENKIPYFFKGVQNAYKKYVFDKFSTKKQYFSNQKKRRRSKKLAEEYEFYDWIKMRLFQQLQILYGEHNTH